MAERLHQGTQLPQAHSAILQLRPTGGFRPHRCWPRTISVSRCASAPAAAAGALAPSGLLILRSFGDLAVEELRQQPGLLIEAPRGPGGRPRRH